jgi:hypothetical protein
MASTQATRALAVAGMVGAVVAVIALFIEYQYGLRTASGGSAAYQADQAAFFLASVGYIAIVIGLFRSSAGADGWFGRVAIAIWLIAITAIALGELLGLAGISAPFVLLPIGGVGQILGSILTSVAVWRAGRWEGWRRYAPAAWTVIFFVTIVAAITAIPVLSIPAVDPYPTAPAPWLEGLWQVAWGVVGLALYIEASRTEYNVK